MTTTVRQFETFKWLDVEDPSLEELQALIIPFTIDVNNLEDVLERGHLPKIEKTEEYLFIILRAYALDSTEQTMRLGSISNKIAIFVHAQGLLTVHRAHFSFLHHLSKSYDTTFALALDIINEMLLSYDEPLREQDELIERFEQEVFLKEQPNLSTQALYYHRTKSRYIRKILQLSQSVISQLKIPQELNSTLQDLKDTNLHLLLKAEEIIDDSHTLLNYSLSISAHRNNDVMRLLTVFSAFFLPLTFVVGLYGMNFHFMPELAWRSGYLFVWVIMLAVSLVIMIWFKRKGII